MAGHLLAGKVHTAGRAPGEDPAIAVDALPFAGDAAGADQAGEVALACRGIARRTGAAGAAVAGQFGCIDADQADAARPGAAQGIAIDRDRGGADQKGSGDKVERHAWGVRRLRAWCNLAGRSGRI